jgi:hypothetical protein
VGHQAGQVDGCLDTRIAAADDGHALALEQRAVAVRTVSHALAAVLLLAGHAHLAPARAGGDDHRTALQRGAVHQAHLEQFTCGVALQALHALHGHDVHVVVPHVLLQRGSELRPLGVRHRDEVVDAQRVQRLAAEAFGHHAGADALARGVHRRRRAGRAAADDQHVVRRLVAAAGRHRAALRRCRPWPGSPRTPCGPGRRAGRSGTPTARP